MRLLTVQFLLPFLRNYLKIQNLRGKNPGY
ncbi:Uncharacterised protein [Vibrio cholerae]|nr:Uncharacterised protein [Vibrio cholerae]